MRILLLLPVALCSCQAPHTPQERALLAADRAFASDTQARRLEGWVAAFHENGSQVDDQLRPVTGHAAVRAHMREFFALPENELCWEPTHVQVAEGGHLGATSGRFKLSVPAEDGTGMLLLEGRYFDIWTKREDGSWALLYDVGESDLQQAP